MEKQKLDPKRYEHVSENIITQNIIEKANNF